MTKMEDLTKSTIIECVASEPSRDTQGEVLDVDGADLSPLHEGRGFVNSDHMGDFAHLVGRVMDAKKIKGPEDCQTPKQMEYWKELQKPYIWTKIELWDGHGHPEADAISSIYKFYGSKNEKPPIKVSVEGKTLERGQNKVLKRTLIKGVALTVQPANRQTRTDVVEIVKSMGAPETLIKSENSAYRAFIERDEPAAERLFQLAVTARDLLKSVVAARKAVPTAEDGQLKCVAALKRLRNLRA